MEDSVRLWDTLLVDPNRFVFTNFVCVALVSFVRDDIIDGDFACCMENLQKASNKVNDVRELLNKANDVCAKYNKYEVGYLGVQDDQSMSDPYIALLNKHV